MAVVIRHVTRQDANDAFLWHCEFSAADENLFPRTWDQFEVLANEFQLICAVEDGNYVGLCYYVQDEKGRWEVGGLMVAANQQDRSLGSVLTYIALSNLLVDEQPLERGEPVISHVHRDNKAPRGLVERLKFVFRQRIKVPGASLPGLKTDDEGFVHGDEFELSKPDTLLVLADWCDGWAGELRDGTPADIQLRQGLTLAQWAEALREIAAAP